jgi:hypothetical protein
VQCDGLGISIEGHPARSVTEQLLRDPILLVEARIQQIWLSIWVKARRKEHVKSED